MVKMLTLATALLLLTISQASAQAPSTGHVVASCGSVTYTPGENRAITVDTTGDACTAASVSASITGFPGASPTTGTPISVTTGGVTGTLPAGAVVVASNVGTTNVAYCKLGASATTADQPVTPNGGWFAFTVGAATQLTCITSTSTTTVNMVGGSGLPTGTGGGGGGTGGGGDATAANQTNGSQKTQIVDGSGNVIASTSNALNVSVANANANGQAAMSGSSPVVIASNQSVADPCMFQAKTNLLINQNGTSSVQLVGVSGSTTIYVCSLSIIAAGATTVAFTTGTGTACVTGNAGVIGSTTSNIANSMSFAANGGLTLGNGQGTIAKGAASSELCMINGSNVYVSGNLTYVQQ